MVEYHEDFFVFGLIHIHGSNDEKEDCRDDLLDLSSWIKSGNEYVQGANDEHASQWKVVDDECRDTIVFTFKPTITEQV